MAGMTKMGRRFRVIAILGIETLVLLETGLQGLSWIQHVRLKTSRERQVTSTDPALRRGVLCIGDSFTFGTGASASEMNSYPTQLEQLLNSAGTSPPWRVFNFGKPGRNSWEVIRDLDGWLQRVRPAYCLLLIGANDAWNHEFSDDASSRFPDPGGKTGSLTQWQWKFRTGRLFALLVYNLRHVRQRSGDASPGRRLVAVSPPREAGSPVADSLNVQAPPAFEAADIPLDELRARGARLLLDDKDYAGAEAAFRSVRILAPDDVSAGIGLGRALLGQYKRTEALALASLLKTDVLADVDASSKILIELGWLYVDLGDGLSARELAEACLRSHPKHLPAYQLLIQTFLLATEYDIAERCLTRAFSLASPTDQLWPALLVQRVQVRMARPGQIELAYEDLLAAYRHSPEQPDLHQQMRHLFFCYPIEPAAFARKLQASFLPADETQRVQGLFDAVRQSRVAGPYSALGANLQRIAGLCARRGTRLVVLSYPSRTASPAQNIMIQTFAEKTGTSFINVEHAFLERVEASQLTYDAVLLADGHPNDGGYQIMAQVVAEGMRVLEVEHGGEELVRDGQTP